MHKRSPRPWIALTVRLAASRNLKAIERSLRTVTEYAIIVSEVRFIHGTYGTHQVLHSQHVQTLVANHQGWQRSHKRRPPILSSGRLRLGGLRLGLRRRLASTPIAFILHI